MSAVDALRGYYSLFGVAARCCSLKQGYYYWPPTNRLTQNQE